MYVNEWPHPIHVIGCGGIGTQVVLMLAQYGARKVTLWDDDTVDRHNIPTQSLYRPSDVGRLKVEAAKDYLERQERAMTVTVRPERVVEGGEYDFEGIVISGVDLLSSRKAIWPHVRFNPFVRGYFDGAIGDNSMTLHAINPCKPDAVVHYDKYMQLPNPPTAARDCVTFKNPYTAIAVATEIGIRLPLAIEGSLEKETVRRNFAKETGVRQPAVA